MKIKISDIKNAAKLHTLSSIMSKGDDAYKHAVSIQKDASKYAYKLMPTKVIFEGVEYTGMTSIATIAALLDFRPYNIYQKMRRNNWVYTIESSSKGIFVQIDKNMGITNNNIDEFFKRT